MPLAPGTQLGPYTIDCLIGRGGMGEVYRATDTRLGRSVAIKLSNKEFNDRFEREARAISALNHPNVCTLHDVGPNYLVMEFVEGELLSKIIERGPLPLDKALAYSIQIAAALAAAHDKGIVHRDLKPGNIIITPNGAKVLDFGLAKLAPERELSATSVVDTVSTPLTKAGAILGTLHYMAPEQVEGKEADERSDIFAFGVSLYEMITGHRPFSGDTQAAVLAAILRDRPVPMSQRQPATPRALERVVRRCLEKKPAERWRSADALKGALETIDLDAAPLTTSSGTPISAPITAPVPAASNRKWIWLAVAVLLLGALGFAGWSMWKPAAPQRATRFQVELPEDLELTGYVSVSPDGRKLLFTAGGRNRGVWTRDLDTLEWRRLPGTETGNAVSPGWSPDGRFVSYGTDSELKKVDLTGGPPVTLCKIQGLIGISTWTPDGTTIVFGSRGQSPLYRVSSSGGIPEPITVLDREHGNFADSFPQFLPDGKHFLFVRVGGPAAGVYVGSLDAKPEEQQKNRILNIDTTTVYASGKLFFLRDDILMAQDFDTDKLELTGEPVPVAERIDRVNYSLMFAVSPSGVLAYRQRAGQQKGAGGNPRNTAWYNRAGKQTSSLEVQNQDTQFRLSPDARRAVSHSVPNGQNDGLWMNDLARGLRTRLTFQQPEAQAALWSPDGARVYYRVRNEIYQKDANGAGEARQLLVAPANAFPSGVTPSGKFLLVSYQPGDLWLLPLQGDAKPIPLLQTQANERLGTFSPDGRWVAYYSDESGRIEVYVRLFVESGPNGPAIGDGKWQVSRNGATVNQPQPPRWTKNGREIVFRNGPELHAVAVNASGGAFQPGQETTLFMLQHETWDVTADGERFLITTAPGAATTNQGPQAPITVVLNWEAAFKK